MSAPSRERVRSQMTLATALSGFADKRLSAASGSHPKTCAKWRREEATPSGEAVLRMMAEDAEICAALLRAARRLDEAQRVQMAQALRAALEEFG